MFKELKIGYLVTSHSYFTYTAYFIFIYDVCGWNKLKKKEENLKFSNW